MIYRKQLIKELTLVASGVFLVLVLIMVSTQLINLLSRLSAGRIYLDSLGVTFATWILGLTPLLFILTVFISIITVFNRYWINSEMSVWLSSGLSIKKWVAPILLFVTPFVILTAISSLWLNAWAESKRWEFYKFIEQKQSISLITEGVFKKQKDKIYFVELFDAQDGEVKNVFIQSKDKNSGNDVVVSAKAGKLSQQDGKTVLTLSDGYYSSGKVGDGEFETIGFESTDLILESSQKTDTTKSHHHWAMPSELYQSKNPRWNAELMWRVSMPITIPILSLLALSLSYHNPRSGNTNNIILALSVFFCYQTFLIVMRSQINNNHIGFWTGLLTPHIIMFIIAIIWLNYRNNPISFLKRN